MRLARRTICVLVLIRVLSIVRTGLAIVPRVAMLHFQRPRQLVSIRIYGLHYCKVRSVFIE